MRPTGTRHGLAADSQALAQGGRIDVKSLDAAVDELATAIAGGTSTTQAQTDFAAVYAKTSVAQATIVHYFAVRDVVPSLVLVVVVWYAIRVDAQRAALYGLAAGLCEDVLAAQSGGAWTISMTLVAVLCAILAIANASCRIRNLCSTAQRPLCRLEVFLARDRHTERGRSQNRNPAGWRLVAARSTHECLAPAQQGISILFRLCDGIRAWP